jgi:outer membrane lipoprotein-sorting protein
MAPFLASRRLRWAAPAVVAAAIAAAALTSNVAANASGQPKLAPQTAAELLAAVEQASPPGLSGTVVETAKLGLPSLPDIGGSGGSSDLSLQNLITGSHTMRVWYAGAERQRLALLGQLSESDVVHNGQDLWTYSSTDRAVTHTTLSKSDDSQATEQRTEALTPQVAAQEALSAIDPTTTVQVDATARVAGVAAYQLDLAPKDTRSLIGSVRIAIAASNSVPLRVQVFARGATSPAFEVGFTDVSFTVPPNSVFDFVPPAGATVTQQARPFQSSLPSGSKRIARSVTGNAQSAAPSSSSVLGKGWTAVVETTDGDQPGGTVGGADAHLLDRLATPVAGGRLITGTLVSVFITDDGHIFAGAVTPAALLQVASTGKGL